MKNVKHISLSITERCNLKCVYCFETSKLCKTIPFDTAIRVIDYELEHSSEYSSIAVDFMGGEPFLEFDLIRQICEHYWSLQMHGKIKFMTTTNGTLVHGPIKQWLETHRDDFVCALSLDGDATAHNMNRCNSFARIDVDYFRRMWPQQKVKAIVSHESLCLLSNSVKYLHQCGFPKIEIKLAYGFDWSRKEQRETFLAELEKLVEYYTENPDLTPCSFLDLKIEEVLQPVSVITKWCNAGGRTISYNMDGVKFPCRYYQDLLRKGNMTLEEIWAVDYSQIHQTLEAPCKQCILHNLCRTCYAFNYEQNGSFGKKNNMSCAVTRDMAYMTVRLTLNRIEKADDKKTEQQLRLLDACRRIEAAYTSGGWYA